MKVNKDINVPFTENELKQLNRVPFLVKAKILFIILSFYLLFGSIVFWVLAFKDENINYGLLITAICCTALGIIFFILEELSKVKDKKVLNKFSYRVLKDGLGIDSYKGINSKDLSKDLLSANKLFNQTIDKYYINNYSFNIKGHQAFVFNIKQTKDESLSNNSVINSALNISSKNIGNNNIRNTDEVPFQGFAIQVKDINKGKSFEIREIKDSLSYSLTFREENKIKVDDEFDSLFETFSNGAIIFSDHFKNTLLALSNKEKGILIKGDEDLYICFYGNYINLEKMKEFNKQNNPCEIYLRRKEWLNSILTIIEEFL